MTALFEEPANLPAGTAWRRLLAVGLRDMRPAPLALLAAAGIPAVVAAMALMSPATVFTKVMTQDLLFNLSGAWHVYLGHTPHVDFHDPSGRLSFLLTALGFHLVGPGPAAFLVNVAIATALLFAASFLAAIRRLPLLPAALFVVFCALLALMPANVGDRPDEYTFAMSYNRYGWCAYGILALILFVRPLRSRHTVVIDLAVAASLLAMMFYLKITYFVAGLMTVVFAILVHAHVRRVWRAWLALVVLLVANALAPYNHPYVGDILSWLASGAVRSGLALHLGNFVAAIGLYAPYLAAIVISSWMWILGRSSWRFPLTLVFLFVISLALLSQNSQTVGLPTGAVMLLVLYDQLRRRFAPARNRDIAPFLLTVLAFPFFEVSCFAASIAGYHTNATRSAEAYVVDRTNLQGLAVPEGRRGTFLSFSRNFDYPMPGSGPATPPRYQLTDYEYLHILLQAAELLEPVPAGGIALFDSINPLPFMLGREPARGANLWSTWNAPVRPADAYLADVRYVLVPKFSLNPRWTEDLMRLYGAHLAERFTRSAETSCWILLTRDDGQTVSVRQSPL